MRAKIAIKIKKLTWSKCFGNAGFSFRNEVVNSSGIPSVEKTPTINREAVPSIEAAKKIAMAFEVSLDYLAGEGINPPFR